MPITPPPLRTAVRDGRITPDEADDLVRYVATRPTSATTIATRVAGTTALLLAVAIALASAAAVLTGVIAGLVGAWRWIVGG